MQLLASLLYLYILLLPFILLCTNHQGPSLRSLLWRTISARPEGGEEGKVVLWESGTNVIGDTTFAVSSCSLNNEKVEDPLTELRDPVIFPGV